VPSLDDLHIDVTGWTPESAEDAVRTWHRDSGDVLSTHFFALVPDVPAPLENIRAIRAAYREMLAEVGAAMVSVDVVDVARTRALQVILKAPQQPSGMTYVGSLTLPFAEFSFVIKAQSFEVGMTGLRDAMVFAKSGIHVVDGVAHGWMQDPYDPAYRAPLLRNQADDERWDSDFPDHPLSRCRAILRSLRETTRLGESVLRAPRFGGGS
jgi:hypothetical protein